MEGLSSGLAALVGIVVEVPDQGGNEEGMCGLGAGSRGSLASEPPE